MSSQSEIILEVSAVVAEQADLKVTVNESTRGAAIVIFIGALLAGREGLQASSAMALGSEFISAADVIRNHMDASQKEQLVKVVVIHSPHRGNSSVSGRMLWSESNKEIATLNINQSLTCLTVGMLLPKEERDILIVGTTMHVLAYHVHNNKDIFYKECSDGVKSIVFGNFKDNKPIIIVGGNSSVHGYDHSGNEVFWTAVGDIVTSLTLMDYNKDDSNELIVSSEDFYIRIFDKDQLIAEHLETEVVTNLVYLPNNKFAYSVSNGTIGVYEQDTRIWRVKSKHFAVSMHFYDLLGQSSPQLITGWSNGKVDCRIIRTGDVLFKDNMNHGVAGIVEGDYRSIGRNDLICVSSEGEVRGYMTTKTMTSNDGSISDQDTFRELLAIKQTLQMELKHYESNTKFNEDIMDETASYESCGVIPANTKLQIAISTNDKSEKPFVEIYLSTNNATVIRSTTIFAEGIFEGETHVIHPPLAKVSSELSIPIILARDNPVDVHIKAFVGYPNSIQFHVYEITRQLPKFSMYSLMQTDSNEKSESYVQFKLNERLQRICLWINQNFLLATDILFDAQPNLILNLRCLRNDSSLVMIFEISGKVSIHTTNLLLAADLVQSLAVYLNLNSLESKAFFPEEEEYLKICMDKLTEIQDARVRLETDVADKLSQIKYLIIKAEDSRINDMKEVSKYYDELNAINSEIINGYNIKLQNYGEGVETMKNINSIIQKASRVRVGQNSSNVINYCRTCIKNNNVEGLIKVIRTGEL